MRYLNKTIIIVSLLFSWGFLKAMEERVISLQEALPAEINLYLTQFLLGSNLAETLNNITKLSQVDTYFNMLIRENPRYIGKFLKEKFGAERLRIFLKAVKDGKKEVVEGLRKLTIINEEDILSVQQKLLDIFIEKLDANKLDYTFLDYLYSLGALPDKPTIKVNNTLITPINYVWLNLYDRQKTWPVLIHMIKNGAQVNQTMRVDGYNNKEATLLNIAFYLGNIDFFEELLKLKADPTIKDSSGISVINGFVNAPSFMDSFKDVLRRYGFTSVFNEKKRARTFTVHRKSMHHRTRVASILRNNHNIV